MGCQSDSLLALLCVLFHTRLLRKNRNGVCGCVVVVSVLFVILGMEVFRVVFGVAVSAAQKTITHKHSLPGMSASTTSTPAPAFESHAGTTHALHACTAHTLVHTHAPARARTPHAHVQETCTHVTAHTHKSAVTGGSSKKRTNKLTCTCFFVHM